MAKKIGASLNAWHGHSESKRVPEGVFMRCDGCSATLFSKQVEQNDKVCPECNHHFPVSAVEETDFTPLVRAREDADDADVDRRRQAMLARLEDLDDGR